MTDKEHSNKVKPGVLCLIIGGRKGTPNIGKQVEAVRKVSHGETLGPWKVSLDGARTEIAWLVKGNPDVQTFITPNLSSPGFRTMTLNGETVALVKERNLLPITPPAPNLQVTSIKKLKVPSDATEFEVV